MNKTKSLAAQVAGAVAIVTLIGTSAFAETRHRDATERDSGRQSDHRSSRDSSRQSRGEQRDNRSNQGQTWQRNDSRSSTFERRDSRSYSPQTYRDSRSYGQSYSSRGNTFDRRTEAESFRGNRGSFDRSFSDRGNRPSFDDRGRRSVTLNGRVNRFVHERGGFRVWIDGGRFPIWIPEARIGLFPHLRVGLSLGFGGYYDPAGYLEAYDYYDGGYAAPYYGGVTAYSSALLRGTVESIDYRNDTLVLRDDVTGNFVTTLIQDRRLESLRPGDHAEISGSWTRGGVFDGLRLQDEEVGRY
ncbi:MAG TPA: hypothetical protein VN380_07440 [Thermoanaerobaculia bacterium]|jgi:hypothetical protein|nr:hypothetical protein [Thermoanaerobaculia bacterium]